MTDLDLVMTVLLCPAPRFELKGDGKPMLVCGEERYPITMDQADVLFSTMFFRGNF